MEIGDVIGSRKREVMSVCECVCVRECEPSDEGEKDGDSGRDSGDKRVETNA